jgi:hypothetical protein
MSQGEVSGFAWKCHSGVAEESVRHDAEEYLCIIERLTHLQFL